MINTEVLIDGGYHPISKFFGGIAAEAERNAFLEDQSRQ
jgi:hypothetical protein